MQRTKTSQRESRTTPYARPGTGPDAPGSWKHDLHASAAPAGSSGVAGSQLAKRLGLELASASKPSPRNAGSLSGRISQKGQELLTGASMPSGGSQMYGYAENPPATSNINMGYELFPTGVGNVGVQAAQGGQGRPTGRSVFTSGLAAAGLGGQAEREKERLREEARERERQQKARQAQMAASNVSIRGQGKIWVRVENLAAGTTAEDVQSAFAPSPIISARISPVPSSRPDLVSIDLEYTDRAAADELIKTYDGVVADGNALKLGIVIQSLATRLGAGGAAEVPSGGGLGSRMASAASRGSSAGGKELFEPPKGSKMYSDTILAADPNATIITLADPSQTDLSDAAAQRSNAWARGSGSAPSLGQRVGGGRSNGGSKMYGW